MSEDEIWKPIRNMLKDSNCLKTHTSAGIVKNGKVISLGVNLCAPKPYNYGDKLSDCPRMKVKTGTSYELCSTMHSEVMACLNMRPNRANAEIASFVPYNMNTEDKIRSAFTKQELEALNGSKLYLAGHYWACEACLRFLKAVGISEVIFDKTTGEITKRGYTDKD